MPWRKIARALWLTVVYAIILAATLVIAITAVSQIE
jgi:hypothetical protein